MPNPKGNPQNLKPFTSEYQPANRGRKVGSVEVAVKIRKALEAKAGRCMPEDSKYKYLVEGASAMFGKKPDKITYEEITIFRQVLNAFEGDNVAIKELRDRVYGKTPDEVILDMPEETIQAIARGKKSPLDNAVELISQMNELGLTDEQKKQFIQKQLKDKE